MLWLPCQIEQESRAVAGRSARYRIKFDTYFQFGRLLLFAVVGCCRLTAFELSIMIDSVRFAVETTLMLLHYAPGRRSTFLRVI